MLPPRDDLHFVLFDWLQAGTLAQQPAFAHVDRDSMDAMIDAALDLAEAEFLPHAAKSDANPPTFNDGRVLIIPEVAQPLAAYRESVRDRVPMMIVGFGVLLVAASYLISQMTAGQDLKIIKDLEHCCDKL